MHTCTIIIASNDPNYNQRLVNRLEIQYKHYNQIKLLADTGRVIKDKLITSNTVILLLGIAEDCCNNECNSCQKKQICKVYSYKSVYESMQNSIYRQFIFRSYIPADLMDNSIKWPASATTVQSLLHDELSTIQNDCMKSICQDHNCKCEGQICMRLQMKTEPGTDLIEIMRAQIKQGYKIYYLALMPGWLMQHCSSPDSAGPDISSLLLSIHQHCQPQPEKIGIYAQLHPEGYFQFRPPLRGDDIICCEPESLRKLLLLIRQRVKSEGDSTICWVDCRDLNMQTTGRLAALCDHLLIDMPEDSDQASICARREVGLLLAGLPNSCSIAESKHQILERLESYYEESR